MDREQLNLFLQTLGDETYRIFNESLIPGVRKTYGVSIPKLRIVARELLQEDWRALLNETSHQTQEEFLLEALIITQAPIPLIERMQLITSFIPKIDNWAVCDTFCTGWKFRPKESDAVWQFILPYFQSAAPFERRFGIVMLLSHFLTDAYLDPALQLLQQTNTEEYYVAMAAAWAYSVAFIRYPNKVLPILQSNHLSADVQNKTIQKIRDSRRVSAESKALVGTLRKPIVT